LIDCRINTIKIQIKAITITEDYITFFKTSIIPGEDLIIIFKTSIIPEEDLIIIFKTSTIPIEDLIVIFKACIGDNNNLKPDKQ